MSNIEDVPSFWTRLAKQGIKGVGQITSTEGTASCRIQIWQLLNGCLTVEVTSRERLNCEGHYHYGFNGNPLRNDSVKNDWHMTVRGIQLNQYALPINDSAHHYFGLVDRMVGEYLSGPLADGQRIHDRVVCRLANLYLTSPLSFDVDQFHISLYCESGLTDAYMKARSLQEPLLHGVLEVSSNESKSDEEWLGFIDGLCVVLSLAQRNYVSKASVEFFTRSELSFRTFYALGLKATKAQNRPLVTESNLLIYIKNAMPRLPEVYRLWKLGIALDHYLRAMDNDSLWSMGAGFVVALECLVSAFTVTHGEEFHFTEDMEDFMRTTRDNRKRFLEIFESFYPTSVARLRDNKPELDSWTSGLQSLNRRSFRRKIRDMLSDLDIPERNSQTLQRFVTLRNELVHYGYSTQPTENWSNDFEQVMQMAEFLEEIFLKILEYLDERERLAYNTVS